MLTNTQSLTVRTRSSYTRDADFNYYMDQTRMITEIIKEAKLTGAKDERLPYPIGNDPISKADSATGEQKFECSKYPYRRVILTSRPKLQY